MKKVLLFSMAAVLLFAVVFPVSANPARAVPPGKDVVAFFASHDIDEKYVNAPQASVPADQWGKILAVISEADSHDKTDKKVECHHCTLNRLVLADLYAATEKFHDPVKMQIGETVWSLQIGSSKDAGWVKE
jgi:hypothetical protein